MSEHDTQRSPEPAGGGQADASGRPQQPPGLANAQVTGGGGHVPDLSEDGPDDSRARVPAAGSGVDMKSDHLDGRRD